MTVHRALGLHEAYHKSFKMWRIILREPLWKDTDDNGISRPISKADAGSCMASFSLLNSLAWLCSMYCTVHDTQSAYLKCKRCIFRAVQYLTTMAIPETNGQSYPLADLNQNFSGYWHLSQSKWKGYALYFSHNAWTSYSQLQCANRSRFAR